MKKVYECDEFEYYGIRYCEVKTSLLKQTNCDKQLPDDDDAYETTTDIREVLKFNNNSEAQLFIINFFRYSEDWEVFKIIIRYEIIAV